MPTLRRGHGHTLADILALRWQRPIMQTPIVDSWADLRTDAAVVAAFAFFSPVVRAMPLSWDARHARMLPDVVGIPYTSWIMPHPDRP